MIIKSLFKNEKKSETHELIQHVQTYRIRNITLSIELKCDISCTTYGCTGPDPTECILPPPKSEDSNPI